MQTEPAPSPIVWQYRLLAALLILGAAVWRLLYLAHDCPLDLAPDEAHYWDWSRHLDWSYYSKGPLVAWLIRGGCWLAGGWSVAWTGSEALAVRLPAVVCGALLLVSLYVLTVQVFADEKLALTVVGVGLTLPLLAVGSSLMTIDAPFTCCWGWAAVLGHRALFRGAAWAWPAAGLLVGVGILAKYTMVLWPLSLGLFVLTAPTYRRTLLRPGFWSMVAVAALASLPILIWNQQHDWVTVRHVNRLAGTGQGLDWAGPLAYLAGQGGLLLIGWFVAWLGAMWDHRPWVEPNDSIRYLWWLSAPTFVVFLLFSPKTGGGELNWPVTAYITGLVLATSWSLRQWQSSCRWYARLMRVGFVATILAGLVMTGLVYQSERVHGLLAALAGPPSDRQPYPLRRLDPTCRLRGWRTLATEVDRLRAELRAEGIEPVLAASSWALPGEIGFYCADQPTVYSVGPAMGDRRSQYDFWRPNPIADPERFHGRTFILINCAEPAIEAAFERVGPSRRIVHRQGDHAVGDWFVTVCRGFRGFPRTAARGF